MEKKRLLSFVALSILAISAGMIYLFREGHEVIAEVNGEKIYRKLYRIRLKQRLSEARASSNIPLSEKVKKDLSYKVLEELISRQLLIQASREKGNTVTEDEIDEYLHKIRKRFKHDKAFKKALEDRGITLEELRKDIADNILAIKFRASIGRDIIVLDDEARKYYEDHKEDFITPELFNIKLIAVPTLDEAKDIMQRLRRGEADFDELAKNQKIGFYRDIEGELGWTDLSTLSPEMGRAISKIAPGNYDGPIKGKEAYFIIKVLEKTDRIEVPYSRARSNIIHIIKQQKRIQKLREWLRDRGKSSKIKIYFENL